MARYAREYAARTDAPGWTGGGIYPGVGYRTEGYRVQDRPERGARYDRTVRLRPSRRYDRPYGWDVQPRGLGFPRYQPQRRGPSPASYAADYHGGGYGPAYYTGGLYGRELGRY